MSSSSSRRDVELSIEERRKRSRKDYLINRVPKVITILEEDVRDEKLLFSDANLTKDERRRLEEKEKYLDLTKKHIEVEKKAKRHGYLIPDSNIIDQIDSEGEEDDDTKRYKEQKLWERTKFDDANFSRKISSGVEKSDGQYTDADFELLLDDVVFISDIKKGDYQYLKDKYLIDDRKANQRSREKSRQEMQEMRRRLPVYEHRDDLLQAISENQIVIVQGETGCGKTTQLPQYLHEKGYTKTEIRDQEVKIVGCTQPRRVAAMAVAARVSQEVNSKLGHTVGYSIRFEDRTSEATVIKYMTDGMLLREFLDDPMLSKYSVIIVDEAHERTIHTDILLSLLKDVTRARPDFRLVISSATLDEQKFSSYFHEPPLFKIKGRLFQVENRFLKENQKSSVSNMIDACLRTVKQIHETDEKGGDILVFLPGQEEIEELQRDLETYVKEQASNIKELIIRPIYANLPTDQQSKVFDKTPTGARKVVIATNIAETSITIDGIVFVVDSGFCKQNKYSPRTGMETLAITRISKASADQRSGRAGRNRPGICFRLYTRDEFYSEFEENTQPEILRLNLANVVLLMKTMRISDVIDFEYVDKPPMDMLKFALEQLTALGALEHNELTPLGRKMAEFPLDPKMSKTIITSESYGCTDQILSIISMLNINGTIFYKPKGQETHAETSRKNFFHETGDHLMMLKVYDDWVASDYDKQWCRDKFIQYKSMARARDVRDQLENLCDKIELKLTSNPTDTEAIRKAILGGFFYNVARVSREGGSYRTIRKNQPVYIHPTSALMNLPVRWVMFNEIKLTSKEYMRIVSEIEPLWLTQVASNFYDKEEIEELSKKKMPRFNVGKTREQLNPKRQIRR